MSATYDVVIIGAGAAGLSAALYCARYGHSTLVLERMMPGNQIVNWETIENYLGFPGGVSGADFAAAMAEHVADAGVEIRPAEALGLTVDGPARIVATDGEACTARAVIIAGGSSLRTLGVSGEERLRGRGVSTCATCDGPLFEGQAVGVVGGGDSAVDEALTLTQYASDVVLFHRGGTLSAQRVAAERLLGRPNVTVCWNSVVEEVLGDDVVTGVRVRELGSERVSVVDLAGLFVLVGLQPNTAYLADLFPLDATGHLPADIWMRTPIPGVFAAGDIRQDSAAQLIAAAGDGATAAVSAHRYLAELAANGAAAGPGAAG